MLTETPNAFPQLIPGRGWEGLPQISKYMYEDTYFLPKETYDWWVDRVSKAYANDAGHAQRINTYLKNYWFHPSTPISANAGTDIGLPISCYVGEVEDSKVGIFNAWAESAWLGAFAGGIGRTWSSVREMGAQVGKHGGKSSGIIPFLKVDEALCNSVSQGNLRRMSQADTLSVSHPEIEEFIQLRKPTGDQKRKALDLHHGISIPDAFMDAVVVGAKWDLVSPHSGKTVKSINARELWTKILETRATTGEPYLFFHDNANRNAPAEYLGKNYKIKLSNLCQEIMLNTSATKTNVCCLASINLEYWDEYEHHINQFVADCTDFLDNVLQSFIDATENMPGFENARNAAIEERALGLGVMGFHSYIQSKNIAFESPMAKSTNIKIFKAIRAAADTHQTSLPVEARCPLSMELNTHRRNIVTLAIAPTMSISNLCNLASSGIEPWISNAFSKKLKQGTFALRNRYLDKVISDYVNEVSSGGQNYYAVEGMIEDIWESIKRNEGSVQHLEWMDDYTKSVFKTAFEIRQDALLDLAADRAPFIDQGQSLNIFIPGNSNVQYVSDLHMLAWKRGLKSLYYLRSTNPNRASTASKDRQTIDVDALTVDACPSCA